MSDRGLARSWLDGLLGACITVLLAVFALHVAVDFVQRDWPWIVAIGGAVGLTVAAITWIRSRGSGW